MTVSTEVDHNDYTGNGVTTSFPYTFRIFNKSDLTVTVVDPSETIRELTVDTDYTVTGAGGYNGGNVTLPSPLGNGYKISIAREIPLTQETDLRNQGKFFAEVHEDAFDKLTMLIQQNSSMTKRALLKPTSVAAWYDALNNYIRNLRDPLLPKDAANKKYVDDIYAYILQTVGTAITTIENGLYGYNQKRSFEQGNTLNYPNDILLQESSGEWYRWDGPLPKVVAPGSTPETSGGTGSGKWLSVGDAALRSDLAKPGGAGLSGFSVNQTYPSGTVGAKLKEVATGYMPVVNLALFTSLKAAIDSLPSTGGTIYVPTGRFEAGNWNYNTAYMNKPNVKIIGEKMPVYNNTLTALEGGSVITGRFNVWADNFHIENIGFDMGKTYCDLKFPGANFTTASHPAGGTWDGFAFASPQDGSPSRRNVVIENVIGLLYNSVTLGHAVLCEGIRGGRADNLIAVYGIHGVVFKCMEFHSFGVKSYGQSTNGLIIKSDDYAVCGRLYATGILYMPSPVNTVPWYTPPSVQFALNINTGLAGFIGPVQIGSAYALTPQRHVSLEGNSPGYFAASDINIADVITDGNEVTDYGIINNGLSSYVRISIGNATLTRCKNGVFSRQPASTFAQQLHINNLYATNTVNTVLIASDYSVVAVDNFDVTNCQSAYSVSATGRVYVGRERVSLVTGSKFSGDSVPGLANGWSNLGGVNETFEFILSGSRVHLKGIVKPGTTGVIAVVPAAFRTNLTKKMPVHWQVGSTNGVTFVSLDSGGLKIENGTLPANVTYVTLDGVSWDY